MNAADGPHGSPVRSTLVTLDVPDTWPSPAFTPARPQEFVQLLDTLLDAAEGC